MDSSSKRTAVSRALCGPGWPAARMQHWEPLSGWRTCTPMDRALRRALHSTGLAHNVRLGEYDTRTVEDCRQGECAPPPTDHAVLNVYRHAFYTSVEYYDIALLKMQQSVVYTANIRPICILLDTTVQQRMDSLREYTITGWGLMWGGQRASVLQTVNLTQIDRYTCARHGYRIDHTHICAGDFRRYACVGDSGGPLGATVLYDGQPRYIQFGIVSFARKPCNGVSVFTNVLAYTPWIQRVLQATQS
ncbi:serine protease grass-like [Drosophila miranda]|uniref:serine protease grass-like n=1 Tax=Drosophila miranda TaxID=7229 RepID=UPI00143F8A96|nr:serine protease grass-like [Drosophila miranda]